MVKGLGGGALLMLLSCGSAGCALLRAGSVPESPPLATPAPPPRVLIPAASEPVLTPRPAPPRVERVDPPPPAAVSSPPPAEPPLTLQTTASAAETEQHVRALLANAARDLSRIDYRALGENAKAQYDVAKRFSEQAEGALRDNNVVFAEQLADKAAVLAALLLNR